MQVTTTDRDRLAELVRQLAVVHGKVTLSSGKEADYYVDLRRATLQHEAAPLIGKLLRELVADWDFESVGGLTMGADPVAAAVMHAPGRPINAFVVRKAAKTHGMQRQIEARTLWASVYWWSRTPPRPVTRRSPRCAHCARPGPSWWVWRPWWIAKPVLTA